VDNSSENVLDFHRDNKTRYASIYTVTRHIKKDIDNNREEVWGNIKKGV
jgi:hypothetical protein